MNRRNFIKDATTLVTASSVLQQCTLVNNQTIKGKIVGANAATGHLLRTKASHQSTKTIQTGTVIIGGGISGLSAARWLKKNGNENFLLLELDNQTGGNAATGSNQVSAYPWGAHYIPLPNNNLQEYFRFLEECKVITGYDETGLPLINEYYLCFEPQERLYINGHWQEGIIPDFGVPEDELEQIKKFLAQMNVFRLAKGSDDKEAFTIPVSAASADPLFTALDNMSMKDWLLQQNYTAAHLHWYCNYCCRDDFGTDYSIASAWAGIHYFAGRKGKAANAPAQSVITWPEGNSFLVKKLRKDIAANILTNHLATNITINDKGVMVQVLDVKTSQYISINAVNCIVATPQFIAAHLLEHADERKKTVAEKLVYQPWMVANITVNNLQERSGQQLCWDNVLYKSKALGYVEATHQRIEQLQQKKVLTYYLPLTEKSAAEERQLAFKRTYADWLNIIMNDLSAAHTGLAESIENVDIWIWGHGMISPQKGFLFGEARKQLQQPVSNKIFFAHTDVAGISIFEEAFYQGVNAAKEILKQA